MEGKMQTRNYDTELEELMTLCRSQDQLLPVQTNISENELNAVKFMWLTSDGKQVEGESDANS
jgi:hypothetical protein